MISITLILFGAVYLIVGRAKEARRT
jgi:hypothetical protein